MDWITDPQAWVGFATLTFLEIVLGIDNVIFISILAGKLPREQQGQARYIGLVLAMFMRIALLFSLSWIIRLTAPLFAVLGQEISGRDLVLLVGGLFLLAKSTHEIHERLEGEEGEASARVAPSLAQRADPDHAARHRLLARLGDHRRRHGGRARGDDRGGGRRGGVHDAVRRPDQRLRGPAPDGQDAGAQLPAPDRRVADRRGVRPAHPEGLHLLRDGVLGAGGDAEPAGPDGRRRAWSSCATRTRRKARPSAPRRPRPPGCGR